MLWKLYLIVTEYYLKLVLISCSPFSFFPAVLPFWFPLHVNNLRTNAALMTIAECVAAKESLFAKMFSIITSLSCLQRIAMPPPGQNNKFCYGQGNGLDAYTEYMCQ